MKKIAGISVLLLLVSTGFASASEVPPGPGPGNPGDCHGPRCDVPTRPVCFNLVCNYEAEDHHGLDASSNSEPGNGHDNDVKQCRAAATFNALVSLDGGEVRQDSDFDDKVQLEIKCGDKPTYNGGARRLTDLLGTRIQGEMGPFPSIILPRGALHTGSEGHSGDHVSFSTLEFDSGDIERMRGECFIWTGAP